MQKLQDLAAQILADSLGRSRYTVAIAGPPASGKSTLTQELAGLIAPHTSVAVVAMDGFHFDNNILCQRNRLQYKGAPDTFDVTGFRLLLERLMHQATEIAVPVFDRVLDVSRACAQIISPSDHVVLIEGNYLLVQIPPWDIPKEYFDLSVFLGPPIDVLEERLVDRWLKHDHTQAEAVERAHRNDLPNARYVLDHSRVADIVL
ncbi:hypothetical protein AB833_19555 [Chromatiales bacterium (ex Bugula neritina AB1)]|nr:hypothetical protein AB833_19555 [Chromatiales bacterium (ex Bugula neritina AB1)]